MHVIGIEIRRDGPSTISSRGSARTLTLSHSLSLSRNRHSPQFPETRFVSRRFSEAPLSTRADRRARLSLSLSLALPLFTGNSHTPNRLLRTKYARRRTLFIPRSPFPPTALRRSSLSRPLSIYRYTYGFQKPACTSRPFPTATTAGPLYTPRSARLAHDGP